MRFRNELSSLDEVSPYFIVYSVCGAVYSVHCIVNDALKDTTCVLVFCLQILLYFCSLCSERNKASDAETVCMDCRHLEQLLCRHCVHLPNNGVPTNFISCLLTDGSKLDNKSPDLC